MTLAMHDTAGPPIADSAAVFAALGDPTRMRVVVRLCGSGPMSITQLTEGTGVTRQAVTRHLQVLEGAGLVSGTRRGRQHLWELHAGRLEEARRWLDVISRQWDDALERLKSLVEEEH